MWQYLQGTFIKQKRADGKQYEVQKDLENHSQALQMVFDAITDKDAGVIKSLDEIKAVGHRVLHGAEDFSESVIVDDEVLRRYLRISAAAWPTFCLSMPEIVIFSGSTAFSSTPSGALKITG